MKLHGGQMKRRYDEYQRNNKIKWWSFVVHSTQRELYARMITTLRTLIVLEIVQVEKTEKTAEKTKENIHT